MADAQQGLAASTAVLKMLAVFRILIDLEATNLSLAARQYGHGEEATLLVDLERRPMHLIEIDGTRRKSFTISKKSPIIQEDFPHLAMICARLRIVLL